MDFKNFFLKFSKNGFYIINCLTILILAAFIWKFETIKERVSPEKYWENKVKVFKTSIKHDDIKIKSLELELQKLQLSCKYHKKQAELQSEMGKDFTKTYQCLNDEHRKKEEDLKNEINYLKDIKVKEKDLLFQAIAKLESVK